MPPLYEPEPGTPTVLTREHLGKVALYRLPNRAVISCGVVNDFTAHRYYVLVGSHWLRNSPGVALAILDASKKRSTPYDAIS